MQQSINLRLLVARQTAIPFRLGTNISRSDKDRSAESISYASMIAGRLRVSEKKDGIGLIEYLICAHWVFPYHLPFTSPRILFVLLTYDRGSFPPSSLLGGLLGNLAATT